MADATTSGAVYPVCCGTEAASSPPKAGGALANWFHETLSRSRRSSLSSDCSDDSCSSDCSSSGRPSFMSRLSHHITRTSRSRAERSSEDTCSSVHVVPPLSTATSTAAGTEAEAFAQHDSSADSCEEACSERVGYLLRGSPVRIVAPEEFLDPVTDCLILEPVTLLNTDTTLDRLTLQQWLRAGNSFCPRTHTPLDNWICVRSNDDLRARITAWAEQCGIDLDALISAHYAKAASA